MIFPGELNLADSRFARICSTALRSVFLFVNTEDRLPIFAGRPEEGPSPLRGFFDPFRGHRDFWTNLQPGAHGFTFEIAGFRQECALLDQDSPRALMLSGISGSSRRLQWHVVRQQAGAGGWMFALESILVTGRPSSRFPHVVFRCRDIDLFVFRRLPRLSNNFTASDKPSRARFSNSKWIPETKRLPQSAWFPYCLSEPLASRLLFSSGALDHYAHRLTVNCSPRSGLLSML